MRWPVAAVTLLALSVGFAPGDVAGVEQTIMELRPEQEQRVIVVGRESGQGVSGVEGSDPQRVEVAEPPSAAGKRVSVVGKVMVGIAAAVASIAAMAAMLLLV